MLRRLCGYVAIAWLVVVIVVALGVVLIIATGPSESNCMANDAPPSCRGLKFWETP